MTAAALVHLDSAAADPFVAAGGAICNAASAALQGDVVPLAA
ncbi:hypothetical protein [Tardiphaga robiniae]|nr:hypothetical protein [Tardiphaga robiniae]